MHGSCPAHRASGAQGKRRTGQAAHRASGAQGKRRTGQAAHRASGGPVASYASGGPLVAACDAGHRGPCGPGPDRETSFFNLSLRRVGWQDVLMGADTDFVGRMGPELEVLLPQLDERSRRLVLGAVARAAGGGGITAVPKAAGASWQTVADSAAEP